MIQIYQPQLRHGPAISLPRFVTPAEKVDDYIIAIARTTTLPNTATGLERAANKPSLYDYKHFNDTIA